jgi:hypothetical protein
MARVTFETTVKIESLGKWQGPILEVLGARFPEARIGFVPLPMGRPGIVVHWTGFRGHDVVERQQMVRDAIAELGRDASNRVAMIVTLTPEEAVDMDQHFPPP